LGEHGLLEPLEQRHPGAQRLGEVELAAHGRGGDLLDPVTHAGVLGDQLDHLLGEEGRVDVRDQKAGRGGGRGLRARPCRHGILRCNGAMTVPLPSAVIPDSVTTQPAARSPSSSRPIWVGGGTTTSLSMVARWIWQWRPTVTPSISTESDTFDHELMRTPGESTELEPGAPETTTPGEMIEATAEPPRPGPPCPN